MNAPGRPDVFSAEELGEMFLRMARIRHFELAAVKLQKRGEIPGAIHTSIGQEGATVGACTALRADDYVTGNHRSHGHPIGKGAALGPLMAELLGKATGVNKGKGGSMHLADFSVGSVGESGIVGAGIPIATGAGLSAQVRRSGQVSLCFFGDGAANQGTFHESLNLASVWELPVVYFCENNKYAATTPSAAVTGGPGVAGRAAAYGIPGVAIDGQDAVVVRMVVAEAAERARGGKGPTVIEALTYRFHEHAEGLPIPGDYRSAEEISSWERRDPLVLFRRRLVEDDVLDDGAIAALDQQAADEVAAAVRFAIESPLPDPSEAFTDLYADSSPLEATP